MRRALVKSGFVLLLLSVFFASVGAAQTPCIAVYFDRALTQQVTDCPYAPPGSVLDTLYVAAFGFSTPIEGIEYKIQFPPEIAYVGDVYDLYSSNGLKIGDPYGGGVSLAFFKPVEALNPVIIQEIVFIWLCQACGTVNVPITPVPHPATGYLRAVTSDLVFEDVIGLTSIVCPTCAGCAPRPVATTKRGVPAGSTSQMCILDCPAGDGGVILPGELPEEHHSPDLDGDGLVSLMDYAEFGIVYYMAPFDPDKDFYCSGNIDLIDFVLFARHWQHSEISPVESTTWGSIKARFKD